MQAKYAIYNYMILAGGEVWWSRADAERIGQKAIPADPIRPGGPPRRGGQAPLRNHTLTGPAKICQLRLN